MKLVCVKIKQNLTLDKEYTVMPDGSFVLVYDDSNHWIRYKLSNFKPIEEETKEILTDRFSIGYPLERH